MISCDDIMFIFCSKNLNTYRSHILTVYHREEMFGVLDLLTNDNDDGERREEDFTVATRAVFFHDLVYRLKSCTNEEDSAEHYTDFKSELPEAVVPRTTG